MPKVRRARAITGRAAELLAALGCRRAGRRGREPGEDLRLQRQPDLRVPHQGLHEGAGREVREGAGRATGWLSGGGHIRAPDRHQAVCGHLWEV